MQKYIWEKNQNNSKLKNEWIMLAKRIKIIAIRILKITVTIKKALCIIYT